MTDDQHIDLITAYINGTITPDQQIELNTLIEEGTIDILDIKELEMIYENMGSLPSAEASPALRERFYTMLEAEKERRSPTLRKRVNTLIGGIKHHFSYKQLAFTACVFLIGLSMGNWLTPFSNYRQQLSTLSSEVSQMREVMMLSLLDANSPSERLKAVNISTGIQSADSRVSDALLKTLNTDSNVNVRLAAIEALVKHASDPYVRKGLVQSISTQTSPLVQVALADAMLTLQEHRSVEAFRALLRKKDLNQSVRDKLQHTVTVLS